MKVLLTGGGTAGHINPALAIAETILQNDPGSVISFVGIENGKECDLVPREGYPLYFVESMGIRRSLSLSNIKALFLAFTSPYSKKTLRILDQTQPDIVIGTGGYACWPIMAAAARRGIPTAVHESNALPGLAVRRLQGKVDRIWVNFEATRSLLKEKEKVVRVGNPLRGGFGALSKEEARRRLGIDPALTLILSFGGSLGAEAINRSVIRMMKNVIAKDASVMAVHATGKRNWEESKALYERCGLQDAPNCVLYDYIYDMSTYMAAADIIVSRAGAMTLSEISLMKKASVLIPSPYVADNHQYKNAKTLADADAALLVEEANLESGMLENTVRDLLASGQKRRTLETNVQSFADPNANKLIWNEILHLTKRK